MKVSRPFEQGGVFWVHVSGHNPANRSHAPNGTGSLIPMGAVRSKRGWCYFRRATRSEVITHLAALATSEARAGQFAAERKAVAS